MYIRKKYFKKWDYIKCSVKTRKDKMKERRKRNKEQVQQIKSSKHDRY